MKRICTALALTTILGAWPALADEVWSSDLGEIVYEADSGEIAILSFSSPDYGNGQLFVIGLGGNYDNRGEHEGFWISDGNGSCPAELTGPDGQSSNNWGRVLIEFEEPGFPSAFDLELGNCFDEPNDSFQATPEVGGRGDSEPPKGNRG